MSKRDAINGLLAQRPTRQQPEGIKNSPQMKTNNTKKKATYELDGDLHIEFKRFAASQNKPMVEILETALKEYIKKHRNTGIQE